jgi:hypothetical protein
MKYRVLTILFLICTLILVGCQGFNHCDNPPAAPAAMALNQGYALLYATLSDDSQVDKVLMIKNSSKQIVELIKSIARFTLEAKDQLDAFAKADTNLSFKHDGLPELETKTRNAISSATAKQILFSNGKHFDFNILMTQHQALNYINNLSATLSKQEPDKVRKQYLEKLAEDSMVLHDRVIDQLQTPYVGVSK